MADLQEVVQLLLKQPNILCDMANNIGLTPLYNAAEKGSKEVVRMLLAKGAFLETIVDRKTPEYWINKRFPGLLDQIDTVENRTSRDSPEAELFKTLYYKPSNFKADLERLGQSNGLNLDATNGTLTLLQYCCDLGYADLVDALLEAEEGTAFRGISARGLRLSMNRPEIRFAVKELARRMAKPTQGDLK